MLKTQGYNTDRAIEKVAETFEIEPEEICKPDNQSTQSWAFGCIWGRTVSSQKVRANEK